MNQKKPKGRMSAYTFFVQTCRDEHRRWYPDENVNFTEFSKKCSARWKLMTEEQKSRFVEMSNGDKHRYETEMAKYSSQSGESRKRKKRDPMAPKRPLSAFFLFCQDERPKVRLEHPATSISEIAKIMGERWSKIDPDRKKAYEEEAIRAKANYDREAAAYREKTAAAQQQMSSSNKRAATQQMVAQMHQQPTQQQQQLLASNPSLDYQQTQLTNRHHVPQSYQQQMMMLNSQQAGNGSRPVLLGSNAQQHPGDVYHLNSQPPQMLHHHHHHMPTGMVQLVQPNPLAQDGGQAAAQQYITASSDHLASTNGGSASGGDI